ncbi:MAG: UDP-3-O-(3-hydroxymyristoyl)glucosamine N-acyltransferase [Alphaproteobacteria bacterium]|nr:UDP-3-O-(3-hydroxymyristoyl)glucosamine N-acyltransferase [Alphaproteobacteria bacterium]
MKLVDIARALDGNLIGDGEIDIARPAHPDQAADASDLALVFSEAALDRVLASPVIAVMVSSSVTVSPERFRGIVEVDDTRTALAALTALFAPEPAIEPGIHPSAVIDDSARLAADVAVGPHTVIGPDVEIGAGTRILSQVAIGSGARLGAGCLIHPGVRIGHDVHIGDRAILHSNAVIGADGFGFALPGAPQTSSYIHAREVEPFLFDIRRVHSLGTVVMGDDVEVGACSTIDRATVGETRIGNNTKIDNQVMIGHNTVIGENCLLAGHVGISGSVTVGDRVIMAGKVGIVDHVTIGDDANLGARSTIMRDVPPRTVTMGYPAVPAADFFARIKQTHIVKLSGAAKRLRELADRVKKLEQKSGDGET